MTTPVTFETKLGPARKVPKSRIWIEGKRLVAAGFTVGSYFVKEWVSFTPTGRRLELHLLKEDDVLATAPCKVSGKGEKPIIDITGDLVREIFGKRCDRVKVTYTPGLITIEAVLE